MLLVARFQEGYGVMTIRPTTSYQDNLPLEQAIMDTLVELLIEVS